MPDCTGIQANRFRGLKKTSNPVYKLMTDNLQTGVN